MEGQNPHWMALLLLFVGMIDISVSGIVYKASDLRESIDPATMATYTATWNAHHQSWVSIDPNQHYCDPAKFWTTYPVCTGPFALQEEYLFTGNQSAQCRAAQCVRIVDDCGITPRDTVDYLPPAPANGLDTETICSVGSLNEIVSNYSYGLEQGMPPDFLPVSPTGLVIFGHIYAQFNGMCQPVSNAQIVAWQMDPTSLNQYTVLNKRQYMEDSIINGGDGNGPYTTVVQERSAALQDLSCRGQQHTDANGKFSFTTYMPPVYGPPRHLMLSVSAPGFQTLTTRVYFDADWRLQQLTTAGGDIESRQPYSPAQAHGFNVDLNDLSWRRQYPGKVALDPRVAKLRFVHVPFPLDDGSHAATLAERGLAYGHFTVQHNLYLAPLRASSTAGTSSETDNSDVPPIDVTGMWSDAQGALIEVETRGNLFVAREYPHPRAWHVLWGYLVGNTIRGVRFNSFLPDKSVEQQLEEAQLTSTERIQNSAYATGVILPTDPFQSNAFSPTLPQAVTIEWSGGDSSDIEAQLVWSKQSARRGDPAPDGSSLGHTAFVDRFSGVNNTIVDVVNSRRFRYLKLLVLRVNGAATASSSGSSAEAMGELRINEVAFFEGLFADSQRPFPSEYMQSARSPPPLRVTCSSFRDQDTHCYKAFDGDTSSHSMWRSQGVGLRRNLLATPQWLLLDFGAGRGIQPTALRIVCDVANAASQGSSDTARGARGCPMTFALQGSHDNIVFETLFQTDLYDYARNADDTYSDSSESNANQASSGNRQGIEYPRQGRTFYFLYTSLHGRAVGQRCGSCDTAPGFTCHRDSYDVSCDSRYCDATARCAPLPTCPAGSYLQLVAQPQTEQHARGLSLYNAQVFRCIHCPPGRYGNRTGMISIACSGPCSPGYYCPAGSTISSPLPCSSGDIAARSLTRHHSPISSSMAAFPDAHPYAVYCPLGSGSPLFTPSGQRTRLFPVQASTIACEAGSYCVAGVQYPCPVGRYGGRGGLSSNACTNDCRPGYYCTAADQDPHKHLRRANNSGLLHDESGLLVVDTNNENYDSRLVDLVSTADVDVLSEVGITYFGRGNVNPVLCPAGYYCPDGRYPEACPAGTFGNVTGLRDVFCSGLCDPGYYCEAASTSATQTPCPAGRYGNTTGLGDHLCSGACPAGYYCPPASSNPLARICGDSSVYCPTGSALPLPVETGYYSAGGGIPALYQSTETLYSQMLAQTMQVKAEMGYYAQFGRVFECPAGTYGDSLGLDAGPVGQGDSTPTYMPTATPSSSPRPSVRPSTQMPTTLRPTASPTRQPSTATPSTAAPTAMPTTVRPSAVPTITRSPTLTRAPSRFPTSQPTSQPSQQPSSQPSRRPSSQPSGQPSQHPSSQPSSHPSSQPSSRPTTSQPSLNPTPSPSVEPTIQPTSPTVAPSSPASVRPSLRYISSDMPTFAPSLTSQAVFTKYLCSGLCELGHYCPPASTSPRQKACPAGRYGSMRGLQTPLCAGICPLGSYCPAGSVLPTPCPAGRYGGFLGLTDATCATTQCLSYASASNITTTIVPISTFFTASDLAAADNVYSGVRTVVACNATVSLCPAGYFCPEGTVAARQHPCGGVKVYCPEGSARPVLVSPGHYTIGGDVPEDPMGQQVNGDTSYAGYTDTANVTRIDTDAFSFNSIRYYLSSSLTAMLSAAPALSVYSPREAARRLTRSSQALCEPGYFCAEGARTLCPAGRYGDRFGLSSAACSGVCAAGYYCPAGSISATQLPCPAGQYGSEVGMTNSACSGVCAEGYHCPPGSTSATQLPCALLRRSNVPPSNAVDNNGTRISADPFLARQQVYWSQFNVTVTQRLVSSTATTASTSNTEMQYLYTIDPTSSVFCPKTSARPIPVFLGHYTVGGSNSSTRTDQVLCPAGSYCTGGIRQPCPAGRYGFLTGLTSSNCSGLCAKGYYCPAGSTVATQNLCPIGRYGDREGLGSADCSGACLRALDCPAGSTTNTPIRSV